MCVCVKFVYLHSVDNFSFFPLLTSCSPSLPPSLPPSTPQVGSNAGIVGMTKEHLGLALALNVPVFVVVTKIDMCPANILQGSPLSALSSHRGECGLP